MGVLSGGAVTPGPEGRVAPGTRHDTEAGPAHRCGRYQRR
ncbi:hypothetical protein SHJG_7132 [Streptomyces hygroscopicus subsp. jinggangensis 5008]|nr:hypothetical protein SHJG_7132 [Streptomyces hygroscopicus subsp. jinggangensis 5008]AGF66554.1 hypothetical protein SHJGH_6892 [Streptomyces hygroscopicus subsp. jinggangensis TL01]